MSSVEPFEAFRLEVARGDVAGLDRLTTAVGARGSGWLDVDLEAECQRLDVLAAEFGGDSAGELMGWLGLVGFRGNAENYYDPDNSFLNRVLDRRLGIPITLSVVAIEIGRRAGIPLVGIGLPGEFVVAERDDPDRFHNPFRHRSMTPDDVEALLRRFAGPGAALTPDMRRPVGAFGIVHRMLLNLANIFAHTDQPAELEWVLRFQTELPGAAASTRRQLVATLAKLGRFWDAVEVLEALVADPAVTPTADEQEADDAMLQQLRGHFN